MTVVERNTFEQVDALYRSGAVVRYHNKRGVPGQTVADHAWHVAQILLVVWGDDEPMPPELLRYALDHDNAERRTGDIPAPIKWDSAELLKALHVAELEWAHRYGTDHYMQPSQVYLVKCCDMLEAMLYSLAQLRQGNKEGTSVFCRLLLALEVHLDKGLASVVLSSDGWRERVKDLLESTQLEWEAHGGRFLTAGEMGYYDGE